MWFFMSVYIGNKYNISICAIFEAKRDRNTVCKQNAWMVISFVIIITGAPIYKSIIFVQAIRPSACALSNSPRARSGASALSNAPMR